MTWTNEPEFEGSEGREIVSGHTLIATVYNTTDAHLIAAAPDLLAALEDALPWLIKADIDGAFDGCALPLGGRKAWEQIERAIAKAKGA
jgi:hypothetical protein